jgi:hypothetical protein
MQFNNKIFRAVFSAALILLICGNASAQYRRDNDRRGYNRGYSRNYNYGYSYNYRPARPVISVNIGRGYNYNSYYHRPVYRSPYSYVHFGPSFGFRINVLPMGYYPFYLGTNPYYYYEGVYYRPYYDGGYEVVAPPLGATVKRLPAGAKVTVIDGVKYYELGGTFYQEEINEKNRLAYRVVGTDGVLNTDAGSDNSSVEPDQAAPVKRDTVFVAPVTPVAPAAVEVGTRVDKLPEGAKVVIIKKEKYYLSPSGVYYQEVVEGDKVRYEVTGNSETDK